MDAENKSRRQLQAEQTKDNLFIAAVELLTEKDFDDITIRDIVARAQVSIGTFYNYYSTKMEVFYETYRIADHYFTETVAPLLSQGTVLERIMAFFDYYAHYSSDLTDMRMTKLLYNPDNTFFSRDPHQGMVGVLIGILQQGLEEGALVGGESADEMVFKFPCSIYPLKQSSVFLRVKDIVEFIQVADMIAVAMSDDDTHWLAGYRADDGKHSALHS